MQKVTGPTGIETQYTYHSSTGLVDKITDHWGNETSYSYDIFGNITGTTVENGINTSVNRNWVTNNTPVNARYSIQQTGTDGSEQVAFYDVLGRQIRTKIKDLDGGYTYTDTKYNSKGQLWKVSEPFDGAAASYWNINSYNGYGQISSSDPAFGATTSYTYGATSTTSVNNRSYTSSISDATGWVTKRTDPGEPLLTIIFPMGM